MRGRQIQFSEHLDADGPAAHREACRLRLEGITSKPRHAPYQAGRRAVWLKIKCVSRQEFGIGGFTDPEGEGIAGGCFSMKHSKVWSPPALTRVKIREKTKVGEYLMIESPDAIVSLVQMDILEIHTWNSRHRTIEDPDRIVLDLDPGPEIAWKTVVSSARTVRRLLQTLDLDSFVKTSTSG